LAHPTVSIGLPVYNGEEYLPNALDSLLRQDYEDFELIISDNASTDRTPDICRAYSAKDRRIRYYRSEVNRGAVWNFKRVFELARGKYFKWAAHDDECYPSMVRRCVDMLDQTPTSVVLVYPRGEIIDECGNVFNSPKDHIASSATQPHLRVAHIFRQLHLGYPFYGLIRSEILRKTRGYVHIAADWVLFLELAMWGEIREIPEVLFRVRRHPDCAMHANKTRRAMEAWHDPSRKNLRVLLPFRLALMIEYLKSVHNTQLSPIDKALCFITVFALPPWEYFRAVAGKQKEEFQRILNLRRRS